MKSIKEKIEAWMSAVTFAEAGEHEFALNVLGMRAREKKSVSWENVMVAITFAEAGMADAARTYLGEEPFVIKTVPSLRPDIKFWSKMARGAA